MTEIEYEPYDGYCDEFEDYEDDCREYARNHPVYENGMVVAHEYPNGTVKFIDD